VHLDELTHNRRVAAYGGLLGVLVPTLLGWGVARVFGMDNQVALFLGLTLGATSVSISAQTLMELKVLRSRVGLSLLGAAVFDDILVILLLSIFRCTNGQWESGRVFWILVRMIASGSLGGFWPVGIAMVDAPSCQARPSARGCSPSHW
jgi:Kef-type K+ transport system membrane component KefB